MQLFEGTGVALVTPFKKDFSVDFEALKKIVDFVIDGGVEYLVVLGTTGEPATLTSDEREEVIKTIIEANNSRLQLVLGVGSNNTQQVVYELESRDLSAFSAVLSVSPYYNKPTQEGIYQHFKAISAASPLPIILYNVPGRTACNMLPKTVVRLANDFNNIIGIKEAAGDIVQAMKLIQTCPKDFLIISGDDMVTLPMVLAGGAGVISVIGQGFPKEFSEMVRLGLSRKVDEAYELHYKVANAIDLIFEEGNPAGIKQIHNVLGLSENTVRLPLVNVSDDLNKKITDFIKNFDK
jgi:4-hydroxy-tetrahydrodipicolinate synthase